MNRTYNVYKGLVVFLFLFFTASVFSQTLSLEDAVNSGLANYSGIQSKHAYLGASQEYLKQTKREYLPSLTLAAQQDYGTVNGQNGPLYGFGGFGVASSGLPLPEQNWNAAFGALYLVNFNWDFFTFGRTRQRIGLAAADTARYQSDLEQEKFQLKIRITAAYLNLLASQRLEASQERNLSRALVFQSTAVARAQNGLIAGVDSSLAAAEVSKARMLVNQSRDLVKEQNNKLTVLMGVEPHNYTLDTSFVVRIPKALANLPSENDSLHPVLQYYKSRVDYSTQQEDLFRRNYFPKFSLFGVYQTRASGFNSNYAVDQTSFTHNYADGITPNRQNYLFGVGASWNLTSLFIVSRQTSAQHFISQAMQEDYELVDQQFKAQLDAANTKISYSLANYEEAPIQVNAAQQAYLQRSALYENGLTTIVELTQTLYTLNRAETDRDIAFTNVWQAFLLKVAATGNFDSFLQAF